MKTLRSNWELALVFAALTAFNVLALYVNLWGG